MNQDKKNKSAMDKDTILNMIRYADVVSALMAFQTVCLIFLIIVAAIHEFIINHHEKVWADITSNNAGSYFMFIALFWTCSLAWFSWRWTKHDFKVMTEER